VGFEVWISGFGFRVSGLAFGLWVSGFGLRVSAFGFRISGFEVRVLGVWSWAPDVSGCERRAPGFGRRVSGDTTPCRMTGVTCVKSLRSSYRG